MLYRWCRVFTSAGGYRALNNLTDFCQRLFDPIVQRYCKTQAQAVTVFPRGREKRSDSDLDVIITQLAVKPHSVKRLRQFYPHHKTTLWTRNADVAWKIVTHPAAKAVVITLIKLAHPPQMRLM